VVYKLIITELYWRFILKVSRVLFNKDYYSIQGGGGTKLVYFSLRSFPLSISYIPFVHSVLEIFKEFVISFKPMFLPVNCCLNSVQNIQSLGTTKSQMRVNQTFPHLHYVEKRLNYFTQNELVIACCSQRTKFVPKRAVKFTQQPIYTTFTLLLTV
jgi:hypothetical protein